MSEDATPTRTMVVVRTFMPSEPRTETRKDDAAKTSDGTVQASATSATSYAASIVAKVAVLVVSVSHSAEKEKAAPMLPTACSASTGCSNSSCCPVTVKGSVISAMGSPFNFRW